MSQWHIGQTGIFRRTISDGVVDLSTASLQEFIFWRPGSVTPMSVPTVFTTPPGSDGVVEYSVPGSHFDVDGEWTVQFHGITPSDVIWSDVEEFTVAPNLKPSV
jgi:hypothetical protein